MFGIKPRNPDWGSHESFWEWLRIVGGSHMRGNRPKVEDWRGREYFENKTMKSNILGILGCLVMIACGVGVMIGSLNFNTETANILIYIIGFALNFIGMYLLVRCVKGIKQENRLR